ncbi:hypothetical protein J437_LFUL006453 [Ladona fulva]|uniref:Uncharacterized protein n=1 Tax=Ladona fulva TaxID=123851 RepID=A0A8K0NU49_LADFU|nr:hypothetical protein J437_LFUL006453 [Ladona fulva]
MSSTVNSTWQGYIHQGDAAAILQPTAEYPTKSSCDKDVAALVLENGSEMWKSGSNTKDSLPFNHIISRPFYQHITVIMSQKDSHAGYEAQSKRYPHCQVPN